MTDLLNLGTEKVKETPGDLKQTNKNVGEGKVIRILGFRALSPGCLQ